MKAKIIIEVKAFENQFQARLKKSKNDFVTFTMAKSEVEKLKNWKLIRKSDNSTNDKDVYVGEIEFIKEENV